MYKDSEKPWYETIAICGGYITNLTGLLPKGALLKVRSLRALLPSSSCARASLLISALGLTISNLAPHLDQ